MEFLNPKLHFLGALGLNNVQRFFWVQNVYISISISIPNIQRHRHIFKGLQPNFLPLETASSARWTRGSDQSPCTSALAGLCWRDKFVATFPHWHAAVWHLSACSCITESSCHRVLIPLHGEQPDQGWGSVPCFLDLNMSCKADQETVISYIQAQKSWEILRNHCLLSSCSSTLKTKPSTPPPSPPQQQGLKKLSRERGLQRSPLSPQQPLAGDLWNCFLNTL